MKPFAAILRVIPISSTLRPRDMIHSLRSATEAIENGEVVCIFAEGQITRIGQLLPFRRGFERIMKGVDAPIIPVSLDGVWGSIFSYAQGRFFWKLPEAHSLSRHREFRTRDARRVHSNRRSPRRAGVAQRCLCVSQTAHDHAAGTRVHLDGPAASLALLHG